MRRVQCCIALVLFLINVKCIHSFIAGDTRKNAGKGTAATFPSSSSSSRQAVVASHRSLLPLLLCVPQQQQQQQQQQHYHTVHGLECIEIKLNMPVIGPVVILEATAEAQETLVDLALAEEEDKDEKMVITDGQQQQQQQQPQPSLATGDPYGAVLWPASSSLASYLLSHRPAELLHNKTILELGTGTGLVALAAAMGGAARVLATDYERIPLKLLEYAAQHLNPALRAAPPPPFLLLRNDGTDDDDDDDDKNGFLSTNLFDICDEQASLPTADVVVAADIMYEPKTGRCMARRAVEALRAGSTVLIGDSPGRAGRPAFLQELDRLGVTNAGFVDVAGTAVTGERHELICGKESNTVSAVAQEPRELTVAIMHLDPMIHCPVE